MDEELVSFTVRVDYDALRSAFPLLTARQLKELALSIVYVRCFGHGTAGHTSYSTMERMAGDRVSDVAITAVASRKNT